MQKGCSVWAFVGLYRDVRKFRGDGVGLWGRGRP